MIFNKDIDSGDYINAISGVKLTEPAKKQFRIGLIEFNKTSFNTKAEAERYLKSEVVISFMLKQIKLTELQLTGAYVEMKELEDENNTFKIDNNAFKIDINRVKNINKHLKEQLTTKQIKQAHKQLKKENKNG